MTHDQPIVAWRIWRLRAEDDGRRVEPVLESCVYGDVWPAREAFAAYCPEHERPAPECGCGVYAVAARETALAWAGWAQSALTNPIVVGRVQLWGRVLPHSTGYRAELAYPYELQVLAGERLDPVEARGLDRALGARYLVDVVPRAA